MKMWRPVGGQRTRLDVRFAETALDERRCPHGTSALEPSRRARPCDSRPSPPPCRATPQPSSPTTYRRGIWRRREESRRASGISGTALSASTSEITSCIACRLSKMIAISGYRRENSGATAAVMGMIVGMLRGGSISIATESCDRRVHTGAGAPRVVLAVTSGSYKPTCKPVVGPDQPIELRVSTTEGERVRLPFHEVHVLRACAERGAGVERDSARAVGATSRSFLSADSRSSAQMS